MKRLLTLVFLLVASASAAAQTSAPLVQAVDVTLVGSFRLPRTNDENTTYAYGGTGLSYRAATNALTVVAHEWHQWVGEVTVPTPGTASAVTGLPVAPVRTVPRDILAGKIGLINPASPNAKWIGGTYALPTGGTLVTAFDRYDGGGTSDQSHFSVSASGTVTGPYLVGRAGFTSGWMMPIPAEWQSAFGATALTGNCCLSVIGRTSVGPSLTTFQPDLSGNQAGVMVLGYPLDHATLGDPGHPTALYGGATLIKGGVFVAGTRSVLFFGVFGTTNCYGGGTSDPALAGKPDGAGNIWCFDPTSGAKGTHGYPYVSRVWAYDANDLVAVKTGSKQPWDVLPYTTWTFDLPFQSAQRAVMGAAYDAATQRIFLTGQYGDTDGYPLVHVLHVAASGTVPPVVVPPVVTPPAQTLTVSPALTLTDTSGPVTLTVSSPGAWTSQDTCPFGDLSPTSGTSGSTQTLTASPGWDALPVGTTTCPVVYTSGGQSVTVMMTAVKTQATPVPPPPPPATGWSLSWSDEFTGTTLDTSKWSAVTNCGDKRNGEQQCYQSSASQVANGLLTITLSKKSSGGFAYTSGAVKTGTKFVLKPDMRIEILAKLPSGGQGVWPALWAYPTNQWPPEIDILEAVNTMGVVYQTYHWGTSSTHQQDGTSISMPTPQAWHVYAVEWVAGAIRWYVDGALIKTHAGSDVTTVPMQVYLNLACGGSWPGTCSAPMPQTLQVDYVRVFTQGPAPTPPPAPVPATFTPWAVQSCTQTATETRQVATPPQNGAPAVTPSDLTRTTTGACP